MTAPAAEGSDMFEIETARTRIRPWQADEREVAAFTRWVRDPGMMSYISNGEPWSDAGIAAFFERQRASLRSSGVCFGAVELKGSDDIIGVGGIAPLELWPDFHLGWWIAPQLQGQGYATEIAQSFVDYAFDVMKLSRALAICHPRNLASQKVMHNVGMHLLDEVKGSDMERRWSDDVNLVFAITMEERTG